MNYKELQYAKINMWFKSFSLHLNSIGLEFLKAAYVIHYECLCHNLNLKAKVSHHFRYKFWGFTDEIK